MIKKLICITLLAYLLLTVLAFSTCAAEFNLKMNAACSPDYFFNRATYDTIEWIKEETNGNVVITLYTDSSLGEDTEVMEMLTVGAVDIMNVSPQLSTNYCPDMGVYALPFLIKDYDHMQRVISSGVLDDALKEFEEKANVKVLCYSLNGIRHLTTKDILVRTPEDLKGVKIRCMSSPFYKDVVSSLGASPTPIGFSELYFALQTGVVQGEENAIVTIWSQKFYDVQNYLILTGHELHGGFISFSRPSWDKLPKEYQQIIKKAFDEVYVSKCYEYYTADENKVIGALVKKGMNIIHPNVEAFREYSNKYMMKKYGDKWGDLIEAIKAVK